MNKIHSQFSRFIFFEKNVLLLFLIFFFSRIFYYKFFDINFDIWTLDIYWQYFPEVLLKDDLLSSIIYNHYQPPLLNILVGILMKLTQNFHLYLNGLYLFCGFCSSVFIYLISLNFNISKKISFLITTVLMILPTTILFENHLYKEYLTFFFLNWLFYFSLKIFKQNISYLDIINIALSLSLLSITRETFHIFWGYIFLIFIFKKIDLKKNILLWIIFSIFVLPFYLKNLVLFDKFALNAASTYEHLSQKIDYIKEMEDPDRHKTIREKIIGSYDDYKKFKEKTSILYTIPINRSAHNYVNILNYDYKFDNSLLKSNTWFNEVWFEVNKHRKYDFYLVLKEYPSLYLLNIFNAASRHLFSSSDYFSFTKPNADKMKFMIKLSDCIKLTPVCIYDYGFDWKKRSIAGNEYLGVDTGPLNYKEKIVFSLQYTNFLLVIIYIFLLIELFRLIFFKQNRSNNKLIIFWLLTFVFIFSALVVFEDGEIARHRFPFDYLSFLIFLRQINLKFFNKSPNNSN